MKMKIKVLDSNATVPTRGSEHAAGLDLYSINGAPVTIDPHSKALFSTGIALEIPDGYFGGIYARSGIATKRDLRPSNCTGVIDEDYRGAIMVSLHNDSDEPRVVEPKERIAQLIIQKYEMPEIEVVDELSDTTRGEGGFGSTGTK